MQAQFSLSDGMTTALLLGEGRCAPSPEGWLATLLRYEYRQVAMLALGLPVLQQACGISAVLLFSAEVRVTYLK